MSPGAIAHLTASDETMGRLIQSVGPCLMTPETRRPPHEALISAVAHQQLTGRVAEVILKRFKTLFEGRGFPSPEAILKVSEADLRSVGFSRAKALAIRDIAAKTVDGIVPGNRALSRLGDEEIIERLTQVRGVGRWTVEMLLMFKLGRPDVLPADDFGVRKGFFLAYGTSEMPRPQELLRFGERWRPHRSTASWYLWRAVELHSTATPAPSAAKRKSKSKPRSKSVSPSD